MALNATQKQALGLLADEVETASTWHSGAREAKLLTLAEKLRSFDKVAQDLVDEAKAKEEAAAAAAESAAAAEDAAAANQ